MSRDYLNRRNEIAELIYDHITYLFLLGFHFTISTVLRAKALIIHIHIVHEKAVDLLLQTMITESSFLSLLFLFFFYCPRTHFT